MADISKPEDDTLAADLLRGVPAIAHFLGDTPRKVYHQLEQGYIPCGKVGGLWIASRRALRAHFDRLTGAAAD